MQKPEPPAKLPKPFLVHGAKTTGGRGRGKKIGIPTINLDLSCVPKELMHGIYACRISFGGKTYAGAMHYGPRPVFKDTVALEVHVLDEVVDVPPVQVDIEIIGRIRDVMNFPDTGSMMTEITQDIAKTRAMLS